MRAVFDVSSKSNITNRCTLEVKCNWLLDHYRPYIFYVPFSSTFRKCIQRTNNFLKKFSVMLRHGACKWIFFAANQVSTLKMSEQRTECAEWSQSTGGQRRPTFISIWAGVRKSDMTFPQDPTEQGEEGHWRLIGRLKLISLWLDSSLRLHLSNIFIIKWKCV